MSPPVSLSPITTFSTTPPSVRFLSIVRIQESSLSANGIGDRLRHARRRSGCARTFEGSNVIIPTRQADRHPHIHLSFQHAWTVVPLIAAVPWFGTRDWETMYDWPAHLDTARHISIAAIWDICSPFVRSSPPIAVTIDLAIANTARQSETPIRSNLDPDLARKYAAFVARSPGYRYPREMGSTNAQEPEGFRLAGHVRSDGGQGFKAGRASSKGSSQRCGQCADHHRRQEP